MFEIYQPAEDSYLMQEVLQKQIAELLRKNKNMNFLEIGCGSGIQLQTALKSGIKKENIFSVDINAKAVEHCEKLKFDCVQSDLFEKIKRKFNLIVFNPPYLPENKDEPKSSQLATTGGKKGSEIINKFLEQAENYLEQDGKIFLITSSLTKGAKWKNYKKTLLEKKKLFFEELYLWKLEI